MSTTVKIDVQHMIHVYLYYYSCNNSIQKLIDDYYKQTNQKIIWTMKGCLENSDLENSDLRP